jgi:hypothetical protein
VDADFKKPRPLYKIAKPPFYAAWHTPALHDSYTGIRINTSGQVLDLHGQPIPGIYACGDSSGGFGQHGICRAATYGRLGGCTPPSSGLTQHRAPGLWKGLMAARLECYRSPTVHEPGRGGTMSRFGSTICLVAGSAAIVATALAVGAMAQTAGSVPDFSSAGWKTANGTNFITVPGSPPLVTNDPAHPISTTASPTAPANSRTTVSATCPTPI